MSRPMASRSLSRSSKLVRRVFMSTSCLALTAAVSDDWNSCSPGLRYLAYCCTNAPTCGTATCEWMSMVVLFGLISRPGLPCLRPAVGSYLFQTLVIDCLSPSENAQMLYHPRIVGIDIARRTRECNF